jgi:hypothetical protein
MSWFSAVPIACVAVFWLLLPGLPVSYLLGLRGIAALALAPVTSIALIASTAVVVQLVGIDWSISVVLVACVVVTAIVGLVVFLLRRGTFVAADPDPRRLTAFALAGLVPALAIGAVTIVRTLGAPDAISQVFDTPFHYNALAFIRDTHEASALTLGSLGNPDLPGTFYPAAWHDFGSLVMMSTGAEIPLAANVLCAVVALVIWPLSCLLLVRQLFGRNTAALAITGVLSIAFPAFPWDLFGWGVLWPNLFGMAIAPAVLALVLTVTGWAKDDAIGRGRGWLLLAVAVPAVGFAHPNVLFSLVVLSVFPAAAAVFLRARRLHRDGRRARSFAEPAVFVAVVVGGWLFTATSSALATARNWNWRPFETPANAVGETLLNATNLHEALWVLSAVVIVGMCTVRRHPALRWILAAHAATTFLYVLTAAFNRPDTRLLTGYWYNDSHRLAAMLPITGVPLAIAGMVFLAGLLRHRLRARPAVVAVALTVGLIAVTGGLYHADRSVRLMFTYPKTEEPKLVTDEMRAFYARIKDEIPEDAKVIGNPFDGSVMFWALADREVVFPHFLATLSPDQEYLSRNLDDAASDPKVCRAADRLGVEYVLIGKAKATTPNGLYSGITPVQRKKGFELIDSAGQTKLYRITACGERG